MLKSQGFRIVFAGTPEFASIPLEGLLENGITPVAVLTQPDRPAGRGRKLQPSPVKETAEKAGIEVFQPLTLRDPVAIERISSYRPDLMIVVAYGLILPQEVLDLPAHGCWNIHASLLPRWRGAAPIQRAIEAGDQESGVCIMQMDSGLDTGPVLNRMHCPISTDETGGSLHDKLASLGTEALISTLQILLDGKPISAEPQPDQGVTYAHKLVKAEAEIDWHAPAEVIERRIRAFNPWPVAWCDLAGERTRIWSAMLTDQGHEQQPGDVLATGKEGIDIACGDQVLRIAELQRPGGRRVSAGQYLNARSLPVDHGT